MHEFREKLPHKLLAPESLALRPLVLLVVLVLLLALPSAASAQDKNSLQGVIALIGAVTAFVTALGALFAAFNAIWKGRKLDESKVDAAKAEKIARRISREFVHDLLDHPGDAEDLRKVGGMANQEDLTNLRLEVAHLRGFVEHLESSAMERDIEAQPALPSASVVRDELVRMLAEETGARASG